jgi:hypothetical protein
LEYWCWPNSFRDIYFYSALAAHLIILKRFQAEIQSITNRTTSLGQTLVAYSDLLQNAESSPYESSWWQQRKASIHGSSQALNKAGSLFEKLDYRNNPFFSLFVGIPDTLGCTLPGWAGKLEKGEPYQAGRLAGCTSGHRSNEQPRGTRICESGLCDTGSTFSK